MENTPCRSARCILLPVVSFFATLTSSEFTYSEFGVNCTTSWSPHCTDLQERFLAARVLAWLAVQHISLAIDVSAATQVSVVHHTPLVCQTSIKTSTHQQERLCPCLRLWISLFSSAGGQPRHALSHGATRREPRAWRQPAARRFSLGTCKTQASTCVELACHS